MSEYTQAEYKACSNIMALEALKTLRAMTGSANDENPWLGVTAGLTLLKMRREARAAAYARLVEAVRTFLAEGNLPVCIGGHGRSCDCGDELLRAALAEVERTEGP